MPPQLHPLVESMRPLLGVWTGGGSGQLPDGEPFTWTERFEIGTGGTPALWFRQRTTRPDGSPFHAEDGWVRVPPELQHRGGDAPPEADARVELAVASPTGVLEALDGTFVTQGGRLVLDATSTSVTRTPAAAEVDATRRRWTLEEGILRVEFWMATPTYPELFHHLTATFEEHQ